VRRPQDLVEAVVAAKGDDPLAAVTVVCPTRYAAVYVRRALAAAPCDPQGLLGIANLESTTVDALVQAIAAPVLSERGLRVRPRHVMREAVRAEASGQGGWTGALAAHRRGLDSLERTVAELSLCPAGALEILESKSPQSARLVALRRAVRRRLIEAGFVDEIGVAEAATEAVRTKRTGLELGVVLDWDLDTRARSRHARLLGQLGARRVRDRGGDESRYARRTLDELRPCPDAEEEARSAVRSVVDAAERGVALWDQAIFHPASAGYSRLVHHQLEAAGVACCGPATRKLAGCAAARALLGLLELLTSDWERALVVSWADSAPIFAAEGGPRIPSSRWDLLSAAAGIVRGEAQWDERLKIHSEAHPPDADDADELSRFVRDLVGAGRPRASTWSEHGRWALGLMDRYLGPAAAPGAQGQKGAHREKGAHDESHAAECSQVREAVRSLSELDAVSGGTDVDGFADALRTMLESTDAPRADLSSGGFGDGVFVAPLGMSRGLCFSEVVVVGLADAIVPGSRGIDALLADDVRSSDTSGTLETRTHKRERTREDLFSAVDSGTTRRTATYPRCDPRTGRAHVPTRWLVDLCSAATRSSPLASFTAGLRGPGPATSLAEFEMRALGRWVELGGDVASSPVARADDRLAAGFDAVVCRESASFTRFDGFVGEGVVSPFDPGTPVSATRFETYAHCPRRYLLERTLGVERRVLPEELWRMEPTERGSLVHLILESYVKERVRGAPRSLERLMEIAEENFDRVEAAGLVGKRLLWQMDRSAISRDLRRFHREEEGLVPVAAELAFGIDEEDAEPALKVALRDGREVYFRGSVDRVDKTVSGRLVVSDYKTGKQNGLADLLKDPVAAGTLLQLPLYGLAAREKFGSDGPVLARYWLLSGERSAPFYSLLLTGPVETRFLEVITSISSGVEDGCFPAVPGAQVLDRFENCRYCDFDSLCPPRRDRHWARKMGDPVLAEVVSLLTKTNDGSLAGAVVKGHVDPDLFEDPIDGALELGSGAVQPASSK
jgi:ATP-dependent helicase/nuclease subunit B